MYKLQWSHKHIHNIAHHPGLYPENLIAFITIHIGQIYNCNIHHTINFHDKELSIQILLHTSKWVKLKHVIHIIHPILASLQAQHLSTLRSNSCYLFSILNNKPRRYNTMHHKSLHQPIKENDLQFL